MSWSTNLGFDQAQLVEGHRRQLVCSGQDSVDADGSPQHPGDMAAQLDLALDNVEAVLAGAEMTLADVVRLNVYTTDFDELLKHWTRLTDRVDAWLRDDPPRGHAPAGARAPRDARGHRRRLTLAPAAARDEDGAMTDRTAYVLGADEAEIARLDGQAASIAGATDALLRATGIGGPMRVLDLGTGLGHVAFLLAGILDPEGSVLGVDREERMLEVAERRRAAMGAENVEFVTGDARTFSPSEPFDAIVARLLLFHLPDREAVLRRQLEALRPGGTMVLVEFDMGSARAEPQVPLADVARGWIEAGFRSAGADPRIGARTAELLRACRVRRRLDVRDPVLLRAG